MAAENKGYQPDEGGTLPLSTHPKEQQNADGLPEPSQSFGDMVRSFPKSVFFIVGNEFCERFSYYGFRTVLTLYFISVMGLKDNDAVACFHAFTVVAYFTPILGSILADGYIGKFHTILWVSLLYASGNVILAISATFPKGGRTHPAMDIIGLLVIAIGTGGIKPCVSAFGGDQFQKGQERALELFFSVFYFSINAGSTISVLVTPYLREMPCTVWGVYLDSCFALCFGIPAILMICACLFFIFGSFWYKRYPPKENIFVEVFKVITAALVNKSRFSVAREHWLDHYLDDHSCQWDNRCTKDKCHKVQFVADVKAVLRIMVLYLPTPFFWALYDQQGSQWLIQGTQMDGRAGHLQILPDGLQVANPIMIMIFIPIFSGIIYPVTAKFVKVTPLRKMTAGGFLAVLAYVITAIIQLKVNPTLPTVPDKGYASLRIINLVPNCSNLTFSLTGGHTDRSILTTYTAQDTNMTETKTVDVTSGKYTITATPGEHCDFHAQPVSETLNDRSAYYLVATREKLFLSDSDLQKPENGFGEYKMAFNMLVPGYNDTDYPLVLCAPPKDMTWEDCFTHKVQRQDSRYMTGTWQSNGVVRWPAPPPQDHADYVTVRPYDNWCVLVPKERGLNSTDNTTLFHSINITSQGAIYTYTIYGDTDNHTNWQTQRAELVSPNTVPILLQLPQFVVITAAEILFSITGLELSYSQSPASMKSLLQGIWLLCVAIGDCIILIIVEGGSDSALSNKAYEFFLFAGIMLVVIIIFALIAQFGYTYVYYIHEADEEEKEAKKDSSS